MKKQFIKKLIAVCLTLVLSMSLFACSSNNSNDTSETKDNSIQLTIDNYKDYLNVSGKVLPVNGNTKDYDNQAYAQIEVKGASTNFVYKDVTVEAKVTLNYKDLSTYVESEQYKSASENVTVKCNVAGDGSNTEVIDLGEDVETFVTDDNYTTSSYEIVKVTGSVTESK